MLRKRTLKTAIASALLLVSGSTVYVGSQEKIEKKTMPAAEMLAPWLGPYGGVPPWHLVRQEEFVAAFDVAISEAQADIERIASDPAPGCARWLPAK